VVSKVNGPGLTAAEVKERFGFGLFLLRAWSDPTGAGVPELGGRKVRTWREVRILARKVPSSGVVWVPPRSTHKVRVYSPKDLQKIAGKRVDFRGKAAQALRRREATKFLRDLLGQGPILARQAVAQAREADITETCLRRVAKELGVCYKRGGRAGGAGHWYFPRHGSAWLERAKTFLRQLLAQGPVKAEEGRRLAAEAGIGSRFLRAARQALKVRSIPSGRPKPGDVAYWCLPGQMPPPAGGSEAPTPGPPPRPNEAAQPGHHPLPNKGGRPTDERTQRIYEFCYRQYVVEDKGATTVQVLANKTFGAGTIKNDAVVRLYARRYARRYNLPMKGQQKPQG
jgi:hypothetical protein